jgi:hypothetical protein
MPECFVIMPLTTPPEAVNRYGGDADHFLHVLDHLFVPAIEQAGFTPKKPIAEGADLIHAEIVRNLETADLVLCDISALNANVFFEFGIRTALDRPICLVRGEHTRLPFDIGGINCHQYASSLAAWELKSETERLAQHVEKAAKRGDGHNALWRHFGLTQRGTDAINATPDEGEAAALKLILDEIRLLRHPLDGDGLAPEDRHEAFRSFFHRASKVSAAVGGGRWQDDTAVLVVDRDSFDVEDYPELKELAHNFGFRLRVERA